MTVHEQTPESVESARVALLKGPFHSTELLTVIL